jgi:hypothetical protein
MFSCRDPLPDVPVEEIKVVEEIQSFLGHGFI